jgi:hypothetical protein
MEKRLLVFAEDEQIEAKQLHSGAGKEKAGKNTRLHVKI